MKPPQRRTHLDYGWVDGTAPWDPTELGKMHIFPLLSNEQYSLHLCFSLSGKKSVKCFGLHLKD